MFCLCYITDRTLQCQALMFIDNNNFIKTKVSLIFNGLNKIMRSFF